MSAFDDDLPGKLEVTPPQYHAYLVRLWRDGEQAAWRASVAHVATGKVRRFANPQLAWTYIHERLTTASETDEPGSLV